MKKDERSPVELVLAVTQRLTDRGYHLWGQGPLLMAARSDYYTTCSTGSRDSGFAYTKFVVVAFSSQEDLTKWVKCGAQTYLVLKLDDVCPIE